MSDVKRYETSVAYDEPATILCSHKERDLFYDAFVILDSDYDRVDRERAEYKREVNRFAHEASELGRKLDVMACEQVALVLRHQREKDALAAENAKLRAFIDNNMTFYNTAESTGPVLASVSKRIWYHATDDVTSYPFSAVIEAATALQPSD